MNPETPNHALQRTAPRVTARAFCDRSAIYIWASAVRSTVGHAPRHAPPSLSLGSLGKTETERETMWEAFKNGKSIGQEGSESGIIVLDEEHDLGARITLERNTSHAPWAVTCGIYGSFMHTAFASSEDKATRKFEVMKPDLVSIMTTESDEARYEMMRRMAETY